MSPLTLTVQSGELALQGMALVPVSMSLK
uniref:Uncharacterized protein n=1 Tax=mine drainage metagenome TaxID=410659 RepID=E6QJ18_9ZZZZ